METQQNQTTFSFLQQYDPEQRDELIRRVENLCSRIDPFAGISQEDKEQLKAWGIEWNDPFELTNKLVKWLEDMIEIQRSEKQQ